MKRLLLSILTLWTLAGNSQDSHADSIKHELLSAEIDTSRYELLYELGSVNMFNYPDSSIKYLRLALELAQKMKDKRKIASCHGSLCVALTNAGNYPAALDFGYKSLEYCKSQKDSVGLIFNYLQLMNCYKDQEDYDEALNQGYKAIDLFSSITFDSSLAGLVYSILSMSYEKKNQLDSALYFGNKSYTYYPGWTGTSLTLGNIYAKKKMYDSALLYYHDVIYVSNSFFTNNVYMVDACNNISNLFELKGLNDSAIYYSYKTLYQEGTESYREGILKATLQLANLYNKMKIPDSAIKYFSLSLQLKDSLFNKTKLREAQNFSFNEKLKDQQFEFKREQSENTKKIYILAAIILISIIVVALLFRNNIIKNRAKIKIEKAYSELKDTQAQLIQSDKMASLGELTAGIAHEIQNPLNFVNNFSEVSTELVDEMNGEIDKGNLQDAKEIANDLKQNLEKINHHGKRAGDIVKGMLQHSRSGNATKEPTDINKLVDEYLRLAYHGLRAKDKSFNATLNTDFDETIGNINIIPQDIGRVILNLITNAFYAVQQKQKVSPLFAPTVLVSAKKINGKVEISVTDNGNGIPQKILDKIFQPFFTTKPTGQGTGLGLSLSYDIVKAHGGELKVESREGEGSKFIVELPV